MMMQETWAEKEKERRIHRNLIFCSHIRCIASRMCFSSQMCFCLSFIYMFSHENSTEWIQTDICVKKSIQLLSLQVPWFVYQVLRTWLSSVGLFIQSLVTSLCYWLHHWPGQRKEFLDIIMTSSVGLSENANIVMDEVVGSKVKLTSTMRCQQHPHPQSLSSPSESSNSTSTSNSTPCADCSKSAINQGLVLADRLDKIAFDKHEEWLPKKVTLRSVSKKSVWLIADSSQVVNFCQGC